jgi:hypothetical protein
VGQWDYSTKRFRAALATPPLGKKSTRCDDPTVVERFLLQKEHANGMQNRQTRMLAGAVLDTKTPDETPLATLLQRAVRSLGDFDVVGVLEMFGLSLAVLARRLGMPAPLEYEVVAEGVDMHAGAESPAPPATARLKSIAAELNRFDDTLYKAAASRLRREGAALLGSEANIKRCTAYVCKKIVPPRLLPNGGVLHARAPQRLPPDSLSYSAVQHCVANFTLAECY